MTVLSARKGVNTLVSAQVLGPNLSSIAATLMS
jgi:hypothetical protein